MPGFSWAVTEQIHGRAPVHPAALLVKELFMVEVEDWRVFVLV